MTTSLISVVLPVYNQADHVELMIREYETALARLPVPYELVIVVNGSTDESLEVCRRLESQLDSVCVVHSEIGGWGRAVRLGLEAARGDLLCYTNLARTTPEDLTLLLLYATVQEDVVVKANRKIRDSAIRRLASLLYNLECRALFDLSYWDINGTPKVFPRKLDKLMQLSRDDDLIDVEFNIICRREDYRMLEVPIFSHRRHGGRSTTGYFSAAKLYWGAIDLWRSQRNGIP
jgi:undecaprenyl-phosphate 4-deoxy-4-formamido-L-arabinose transferase